MSKKFIKRWQGTPEGGLRHKVRGAVARKPDLRRQLDTTIRTLQTHLQKLEGLFQRLVEKDRVLFSQVVKNYESRDTARATVYAKEVLHIRAIAKNLVQIKLALEQVTMRLTTVRELGDITAMVAPTLSIIRNLDKEIANILPEASSELAKLGDVVNDFLITSGTYSSTQPAPRLANEEARQVLAEATKLAQEAIEEKFPKLPEGLPMPEEPLAT